MKVTLPKTHTTETVGTIDATRAVHQIGAPRTIAAFDTIGAIVTVVAALGMAGVGTLGTPDRVGTSVTGSTIIAEHAQRALTAFGTFKRAWVGSRQLVRFLQLSKPLEKLFSVHDCPNRR